MVGLCDLHFFTHTDKCCMDCLRLLRYVNAQLINYKNATAFK